jgi:hypothetical protein
MHLTSTTPLNNSSTFILAPCFPTHISTTKRIKKFNKMAGVRPSNESPYQFAYGASRGGAADEQLDINGSDGASENSRSYLTPQYGNTSSEPADPSPAAGNQISSTHPNAWGSNSMYDSQSPELNGDAGDDTADGGDGAE